MDGGGVTQQMTQMIKTVQPTQGIFTLPKTHNKISLNLFQDMTQKMSKLKFTFPN